MAYQRKNFSSNSDSLINKKDEESVQTQETPIRLDDNDTQQNDTQQKEININKAQELTFTAKDMRLIEEFLKFKKLNHSQKLEIIKKYKENIILFREKFLDFYEKNIKTLILNNANSLDLKEQSQLFPEHIVFKIINCNRKEDIKKISRNSADSFFYKIYEQKTLISKKYSETPFKSPTVLFKKEVCKNNKVTTGEINNIKIEFVDLDSAKHVMSLKTNESLNSKYSRKETSERESFKQNFSEQEDSTIISFQTKSFLNRKSFK